MPRLYDPRHDDPLDGFDGLLINGRDPRARRRRAVQTVQAAHRQQEDRRMRGALSREGYRRWRWPLIEDKCPAGLSERVASERSADLAGLVDAPAWQALGY